MRFLGCFVAAVAALSMVKAQTPGSQKAETHLPMSLATCTAAGCSTQQLSVTLSANWRWIHANSGYTNCYTGNSWDPTLCPDPATCANNCQIEGVATSDWSNPYGIKTTSDGGVDLTFVTAGTYGKNIGSRIFLLDSTQTKYEIFKLKNREFTFTVDTSSLPCGLNGALYFVEMDADGGMSKYPGNKAGAKYGTGYCDAQCPHDIKWIHGEANLLNWQQSPNDPNAGIGLYGTCCTELDVWEANSISTAFTAHPCSVGADYRCSGIDCGDNSAGQRWQGVCDKDGCDFNTYRMGDKQFYGPGSAFVVDSSRPITVVTQFITSDNTDTGDLTEIRRFWVQDGKVINTPMSSITGLPQYNSLKDETCDAQKNVFGEQNVYQKKGGMKAFGDALDRGLVLVMSIWDDHDVNMLWLDSDYPTDKDPSTPGVGRGSCPTSSGVPNTIEASTPNAHVSYSNLKVGTIGSTFGTSSSSSTPAPTSGSTPVNTPAPTAGGCSNKVYDQCGGQGYSGSTCCPSGSACKSQNQWYSQCVAAATA